MTILNYRQPPKITPHSRPESVMILHKGGDDDSTLAIAVDGQDLMFRINRRAVFKIMADCATALKQMEPGG